MTIETVCNKYLYFQKDKTRNNTLRNQIIPLFTAYPVSARREVDFFPVFQFADKCEKSDHVVFIFRGGVALLSTFVLTQTLIIRRVPVIVASTFICLCL